jgi:protein-L-isoaspartate(D-aspartate) O-methyltransferase
MTARAKLRTSEAATASGPVSSDRRVLRALRGVPSDPFLPAGGERPSHEASYVLARMLEALELRGGESVLDIGTGSGYRAALLGSLAGFVRSVELRSERAVLARQRLHMLGINNVEVVDGDGSLGLNSCAPYHAIVVGASAPGLPRELVDQLRDQGRLVIAIGDATAQLVSCFRIRARSLESRTIAACTLPSLICRDPARPSVPWVRSVAG